MKVLKFGGTSVGSAEGLRSLITIVEDGRQHHRLVLVVSALSGVTDTLAGWLSDAPETVDPDAALRYLYTRHHVLAGGILRRPALQRYEAQLREMLAQYAPILMQLSAGPPAADLRDTVLAMGERLSAPLVAAALRDAGVPSVAQDAGALVRTDSAFGHAVVDRRVTRQQVAGWRAQLRGDAVPVVTGFIGADTEGRTTTLGRGGSDYSAALLARALDAHLLERWTDVRGLYTADPAQNATAEPIHQLDLSDAQALARAGQLGMHPRSFDPLVAGNIPLHVRCTRAPAETGTLVVPVGFTERVTSLAS
ncbi:MAG: aspartate kinase [Bacteroidetes bacterium]|jgi:aspartate kinase|nr:aspartate kinase [Bacteroidota bacterium]